ncbi:hypothetical protein GcM3_c154o69 [Golovinomyces cichoracearum]|uniref:Uncharacterized protein n=1 Tax=Golovinomyces cichoracearum TaxID=62708 RepID=A0A420J1S0_9PEZI|nr:hypothetical protein GcM3_c154o69 [Golovinomyces cichoracearum]
MGGGLKSGTANLLLRVVRLSSCCASISTASYATLERGYSYLLARWW